MLRRSASGEDSSRYPRAQQSQAVFSEVLEAHSEAVFSEVLEAAAKLNVCQRLEARVWHHLTLELGVTCRRSECSSRNVY